MRIPAYAGREDEEAPVSSEVTSYGELHGMTHEQRRVHFAESVVPDPEHYDDPRVRVLFLRAQDRARQRLAERETARSDGE